jgi:hypothetical protein
MARTRLFSVLPFIYALPLGADLKHFGWLPGERPRRKRKEPTMAATSANQKSSDVAPGADQEPVPPHVVAAIAEPLQSASPPSPGQKLLERMLAVRNQAGKAEQEMLELLATVRGVKAGERSPGQPRPGEARTETTFLGGFDALMKDLERQIGTIANGTAELKRFF